MNELEADELYRAITKAHPDAEQVDDKLMWHPSEGTSLYVGISWYDPKETELALQILYVFPPIFHLRKDRKVEKKLAKMNSKILQPRGFELISDDGATGLLTGLSKILSPEVKTIDQFKVFQAELSAVAMATYFAISDFEKNKEFGW